jgi:hypothetical protein
MNLIFQDMLGIIMDVYIDDVMIKSASFNDHLADLKIALERMKKYVLRMNPFKCAFGMTTGRFLGSVGGEPLPMSEGYLKRPPKVGTPSS